MAPGIKEFVLMMNRYCAEGSPFIFIIDYAMKHPEIHKIDQVPAGIRFSVPGLSNYSGEQIYSKRFTWSTEPVSFTRYSEAFGIVQRNISLGNSYLVNLTFPTRIQTDLALEDIFMMSSARYMLLYHNDFLVFSPETFVRIGGGRISSCPMKGTIDASVPDAENRILNDEKEMAEHNTIVDLIRNDLSIVSDNVRVTRHRYIDRIQTADRVLLQVSSEITGTLSTGYESHMGEIITGMLPAGSVTGAPKKETLRIIEESEKYDRGWYTGIFGIFDGRMLDSCVMIRFIENQSGDLFFKSGGGITSLSDPEKEYDELIAKVYVPIG